MTVETILVESRGNYLGLTAGERAEFPVDYPDLLECVARGYVFDVERPTPPPPPAQPKNCGGC